MSSGPVCRVCLHGNMKLDPMESIPLLNIYERLTNNQFKKDDRPTAFCPFCYQKLLKCYTFFSMAWRAENLFDQLLLQGVKEFVTKLKLGVTQHMTMAPMQSVTVIDSSTLVTPKEIKEEPKSEAEPEEMEITVKSEAVCRMCLADNLMLNPLDSGPLLDVYQKLTTLQFNSEDGRPRSVCPFCYQKLLKCYTFSKMASRSEELFDRLVLNGIKEVTNQLIIQLKLRVNQSLVVTHLDSMNVNTPLKVTVKEEPIAVQERNSTAGNFICTICGKKYETELAMKKHLARHTEEKSICKVCNKVLKNKYSLSKHMKCHSDKKEFVCTECKKRFRHLHHLIPHMRTHTGEKPFPCTVCQKRFNEKSHLKRHMTLHSQQIITQESRFTCNECNKKFKTVQTLKRHLVLHSRERASFPCTLCDKCYQCQKSLDIHMSFHNKVLPPFACHLCDKRFHYISRLRVHLRNHNSVAKSYECSVCHERCKRKHQLITHMRLLHPEQKLYTCNDCDKQYDKKSNFVRHLDLHRGQQYSCDMCDKKFTYKDSIISHLRLHTGETPYACPRCKKRFSQKYHLNSHIKKKHKVKSESDSE